MGGPCNTQGTDEKSVHNFWLENLQESEYWEILGEDWGILLKLILSKDVRVWTGLNWLKVQTGGGLLWTL
jgi:hypothetical protein